jgi:hypothetical protein
MYTLKLLIAIIVLLIFCNVKLINCAFPEPIGNYTNHKVLIKPDIYEVYWKTTKTNVMFEVHSKNGQNNRWAAFGLSQGGKMAYSDIAVYGHNDAGGIFFSDMYINGSDSVLLDDVNDNNWKLTQLMEKEGYMIALFWRPLEICDKSGQDRNILEGKNTIIFAHGVIQNNNMVYHGPEMMDRGHTDLQIYDSSTEKIKIENEQVETQSFIINVNLILLTYKNFFLFFYYSISFEGKNKK